jgi:hypothetical protein
LQGFRIPICQLSGQCCHCSWWWAASRILFHHATNQGYSGFLGTARYCQSQTSMQHQGQRNAIQVMPWSRCCKSRGACMTSVALLDTSKAPLHPHHSKFTSPSACSTTHPLHRSLFPLWPVHLQWSSRQTGAWSLCGVLETAIEDSTPCMGRDTQTCISNCIKPVRLFIKTFHQVKLFDG